MLEIKLFGTGKATYDGQPLVGFPGQQAFLLLCYLLLNPHSHSRERLAAVFWGEHSANASRKHLSQTLWRLRNSLQAVGMADEDFLTITKDRIAINENSVYTLDTQQFEQTLMRYQDVAGQKLTLHQAEELESATELYTGDLLEGLYEDWCLHDRERLTLFYLNALGKLMVFHEHNQTFEQGLTCGERILGCDQTRERVHQQMMRLHWLAGDRTAALAQYKRCAQILRDELGVSPMKETTELYQKMSSNQFEIDPSEPAVGSALQPLTRVSDEALTSFAEQSLRKLANLRLIVQETNAEIQALERLIKRTILGS